MRHRLAASILLAGLLGWAAADSPCLAKRAGIFYSTLYAKSMEPEWLSGFAGDAAAWFLEDIDGDRRDDAVAWFATGTRKGQWHVALSDGRRFGAPHLYLEVESPPPDGVALMGDVNGDGACDACLFDRQQGTWQVAIAERERFLQPARFATTEGNDSDIPLLADIDGDGCDDALRVRTVAGSVEWSAGLSQGTAFAKFKPLLRDFGSKGESCFLGDVDGDGKSDAIAYDSRQGLWKVALAAKEGFQRGTVWKRDFGKDTDFGFVCDADGDGRADIGYHSNRDWTVCYSTGGSFAQGRHRWIAGLGDRSGGSGKSIRYRNKQNPPPVVAFLTGTLSGREGWACLVDDFGRWFALSNPRRNRTVDLTMENTWAAWRCSYVPQIPGHEGTYDSGDPDIHDAQIRMLHDAGFTYVTMDITNGHHAWVDDRARKFFERVCHWNSRLRPGQHKLYVNIALGRTRGVEGEDAFFRKLNLECKRAWDEFYRPYQDVYYQLNGKPLVIHMISNGLRDGFYKNLDTWSGGDRSYIDKVTCRWMTGWGGCTRHRANFYGWDVRHKFGNPVHPEMMPVMPGFWNGGNYVDREQGDFYRSQWMRVIQHQPDSVWVNSLNETWEHTSVEPAYMSNPRQPHEGITMWTDAYGDRMDDFYWIMTRQYMKLYMENAIYEDTYFQEHSSDRGPGPIYRATGAGFIVQSAAPRMAPVLLLPEGFRRDFDGKIVPAGGPLETRSTDTRRKP